VSKTVAPSHSISDSVIAVSRRLSDGVDRLNFKKPITHVYNPLVYARRSHEEYCKRFGASKKKYFLVGMNPGPFGMAQTGVPFGEISAVRDWMKISAPVAKPKLENPKRPVEGFQCEKSEVSGRRLWGWAANRFGSAENFFKDFFVVNYCPLVFMETSGKNFTPDKLPAAEKTSLFKICDEALAALVDLLEPECVVGVGAFAESRIKEACAGRDIRVGKILHPSPASPAANRGWEPQIEKELSALGVKF
jgi:single-strand selective monofunctional uracil DNA glycosylase